MPAFTRQLDSPAGCASRDLVQHLENGAIVLHTRPADRRTVFLRPLPRLRCARLRQHRHIVCHYADVGGIPAVQRPNALH